MIDLSCNYLGLKLRNPIIVGSSGLSSSLENLIKAETAGAGAIVLKSVFEEQIQYEAEALISSQDEGAVRWKSAFQKIVNEKEQYYDEAYQYLTDYATENALEHYISFLKKAKEVCKIPLIASINCKSQYDWALFAKRLEQAGADAIELNVYVLPSDITKSGSEHEQLYFDVIQEVKKYVKIPVSLKIGFYFSGLANSALALSKSGIAGLTLFNRPYNPDIDIDLVQVTASNMFSNEHEYSHSLRWVALLAGKIDCDIAASTGIHNSSSVIKQLLSGADAVQMVSVFYKHHFEIIPTILKEISEWMVKHNFNTISDFKGKLSHKNIINPSMYERVQFIRLFSSVV